MPGYSSPSRFRAASVELFQAVCARDIEGIVAKHRLVPCGRKEMFEGFRERGEHEPDARVP